MPAHDPNERRAIAQIAALTRSARESGAERTAAARHTYRDSFYLAHECDRCPLVEIPQDLPPGEILRRGDALYRAHMKRLALHRDRSRRQEQAHKAAADAADAELVGLVSAP